MTLDEALDAAAGVLAAKLDVLVHLSESRRGLLSAHARYVDHMRFRDKYGVDVRYACPCYRLTPKGQ